MKVNGTNTLGSLITEWRVLGRVMAENACLLGIPLMINSLSFCDGHEFEKTSQWLIERYTLLYYVVDRRTTAEV